MTKVKKKVKAKLFGMMVPSITDNGRPTKDLEMEFILAQTALNTSANGILT